MTIGVACNHQRVSETLVRNPTCFVDRQLRIKLCDRFNSLQVLPGKIVRNARITIREKLSGSGFRSDFDAIYENFYRDSIYIYMRRTESFDFTSILR